MYDVQAQTRSASPRHPLRAIVFCARHAPGRVDEVELRVDVLGRPRRAAHVRLARRPRHVENAVLGATHHADEQKAITHIGSTVQH